MLLRKLLRYASVSAISTVTGLTVLGVLVGVFSVSAGWANVVATLVGTVPSFELNRRWVWRKSGHRLLGAEVMPFVVLSLTGLAVSTLAVHQAAAFADAHAWHRGARTALVELSNLAAYGSLWVVQYVVLDRVLFRRTPTQPAGGA